LLFLSLLTALHKPLEQIPSAPIKRKTSGLFEPGGKRICFYNFRLLVVIMPVPPPAVPAEADGKARPRVVWTRIIGISRVVVVIIIIRPAVVIPWAAAVDYDMAAVPIVMVMVPPIVVVCPGLWGDGDSTESDQSQDE
jgi:hypothetical protein